MTVDLQAQLDQVRSERDDARSVVLQQMARIAELEAALARVTEGASAHSTLVDIYRNRDLPEALRTKAATAALPVEKGKMPTVYPSLGVDRRERWRAYERFVLTKRSLEETHQLPAPGWDAKLVEGVYEAPAGDGEPPMDLYGKDAITAHVTLSELMRNRRNSNDDDSSND